MRDFRAAALSEFKTKEMHVRAFDLPAENGRLIFLFLNPYWRGRLILR